MGHSNSSTLPFEILESIIDNLNIDLPEDRKTIVCCSYAGRTFATIAQERLFGSVRVSLKKGRDKGFDTFLEDDTTTVQRFHRLINNSPHIATYVQSLTVFVFPLPKTVLVEVVASLPNTQDTPLSSLHAIMTRLRNLQKFALDSSIFLHPILWTEIEPRFQDLIDDLAQRVIEIDCRGLALLPVSMFSKAPPLKALHISSLDPDMKIIPRSKVELRSLSIYYPRSPSKETELLSWFSADHSPLDITCLQVLKVLNYGTLDLDHILSLCPEHLKRLHLGRCCLSSGLSSTSGTYWFYHQYANEILAKSHLGYYMMLSMPTHNTMPPPSNLASLHNLRHLTLECSFYDINAHCETDALYTSTILKTLPTSDRPLLDVELEVYIDLPRHRFGAIPFDDIIFTFVDGDQMTSRFATFTLRVGLCEDGHHNAPYSMVKESLDSHRGLRALRDRGVFSLASSWSHSYL